MTDLLSSFLASGGTIVQCPPGVAHGVRVRRLKGDAPIRQPVNPVLAA
jgi:hypothetical protein